MKRIGEYKVISKSERFAYLYKNSTKDFGQGFVIFFKEDDDKEVGFTASKKIGNAVKRNFAKRRLRSLFLQASPLLKNGSYILVARYDIITMDFEKLKRSFLKSLKKIRALKEVKK